jgi:hypothetical protein
LIDALSAIAPEKLYHPAGIEPADQQLPLFGAATL